MDKITKLPTPLHNTGPEIYTDTNKFIARADTSEIAVNIVRAVNNHERLVEAAKMLEDLMTNWGSDFRIETKDLAATIQAGIMIEKFREAINAVDGEGVK